MVTKNIFCTKAHLLQGKRDTQCRGLMNEVCDMNIIGGSMKLGLCV